jgi:hypothetical protein
MAGQSLVVSHPTFFLRLHYFHFSDFTGFPILHLFEDGPSIML